MKKKILFTGGSGLLATNWALAIADEFEVFAGLHNKMIALPGVEALVIDMESVEAFAETLKVVHPDVVIHCASLTTVEGCESDPGLAEHTNIDLAVNVALACKQYNVRFVNICTDHLFAGKKPLATESDPVEPLNEYGRTKALAEQKILEVSEDFLSIRTNFYGWGTTYRHSFSDSILSALRNGKNISLFDDIHYTPVLIETLAHVVMILIEKNAKGIYNVVGNERISKYEFGMRVASVFGLNDSLITPSSFADRKDLVQRPLDLSLSNKKAVAFVGADFGNIDDDIRRLQKQEQDGFANTIKNI
ncbi:SDR family oxidoreductase [Sediminibacterium roseum]|uniref:SDR family oxidoreductase n=1 Tax=Sediminibacterium roseum TaxID=1978412 RepID=A0ABW9ZR75_9BACT|nr:SDR family oxidoreductase [Sediminibacterium roseum]NCI49020.1 SDR family oxidoreductase [Sediminibacterium roseum]